MRLQILLICIFSLVCGVQAQTKQRRSNPSKAQASFSISEFSTQIEKLPVSFIGHSLIDVYTGIAKRRAKLQKGEYETSEMYKERLTRENRAPVIGALTFESTFAFVLTQFYTEYDADNQVLSIRVVSKEAIDDENYAGNYGYLLWSGSESKAGSFIGSNAFGVKRKVSVFRGTEFYLALHESVLDGPAIGDLRMKCSLSPQEAQQLRDRLRIVIAGEIVSPYAGKGTSTEDATIDNPVQSITNQYSLYLKTKAVWLYDVTTGKILARKN